MARGRLISRTLGSSRKFAALLKEAGKLGEFAQLLYPLLVSHTDDFGRLSGDAFTVKHAVFPSSRRSEQEFSTALQAMTRVGLLRRYEVDGQVVAEVVDFEAHQPGLHKRTQSRFPNPPGNFPEVQEFPPEFKRTEFKGTEPVRSSESTTTGEVDADLDQGGVTNHDISAFIRRFCELYSQHRHGARYVIHRHKHVPIVRTLLHVFPRDRLEKLAVILLTTDEPWVTQTDRGLGILSTKASWLDGLLADYEAEHGVIGMAV